MPISILKSMITNILLASFYHIYKHPTFVENINICYIYERTFHLSIHFPSDRDHSNEVICHLAVVHLGVLVLGKCS